MDTISLTSYETVIDQLLEQKKYDEATAHCIHILQSFPRNVNIMRLQGKSFLEKKQYFEACQSFLRVLSVIPTDFIAHIGMSVIREDEKHIDAAIWHMERAFEQQPVNPAIQDELRRLYSLKTMQEPVKMVLSRAALVRMYIRGKLIPQAIAEAEASLNEEPERLDVQTTLAQLYFSTGITEKSYALAEKILETQPNNLTANQVMSTYLSAAGRQEEAGFYTQQCYDLDPGFLSQKKDGKPGEGGFAQPVSIEKLDDLSSDSIREKSIVLGSLLDDLIPTDSIENWLNRMENYQRLLVPLPLADSETADTLEQELPVHIKPLAEEVEDSSIENGKEEMEDIPGVENDDSTRMEFVGSKEISEEKLESMVEEPVVTGSLAHPPDNAFKDLTGQPTILPEPIVEQTSQSGSEPALSEMTPLENNEFPVSAPEEVNGDFGKSLDSPRVEEDLEITLPFGEVGDGITKSEVDSASIEQEPPAAKTDDVLQKYDDAAENVDQSAPLPVIINAGEAVIEDIAFTEDAKIEPTILSEGWIPIRTPSPEAVETDSAASTKIQEIADDDSATGQTSLSIQFQNEVEEIAIEETAQEINLPKAEVGSHELVEEITKPVQVTPSDSSGEASGTAETVSEISDAEDIHLDTNSEPETQSEEEIPEKKHGFLAWLKSVKSVVQEEIKEPKLPAWMQTGKPSERIKVPEINDLLDQEPGKLAETPSLTEMPQSFTADDIPEEEQEINFLEEDEHTIEIEPERDSLIPPESQEEVWEVGYQDQETGDESEPIILEQPKSVDDLERARADINQGNFLKAAERYKKLIKRGINLNNVIQSLEEEVNNHPGELKLFQTLGDAYVRTGRLQDALDAYTKAEELLK